MINYKTQAYFDATYNRARLIAIALIGGLFVEAVVVEMLVWLMAFPGFTITEEGLSPNLRYLFLTVGLSDVVFLPLIRRSLLANRPNAQPAILISRLMTTTIVTLVISNFPAIMGLVIFLIWGGRWFFYPLWLVSLFFMLVYFPQQTFWEEWVQGGGRLEL